MRGYGYLFFGIFITILNAQTDSLFLRLPEYIYTTTTSKFSVYYKNVIQTKEYEKYSFTVNCNVGYDEGNKYNLDSLHSGIYPFTLDVKDSLGNVLESDESQLIVTENEICHNDTLKMLYIGDSLTLAGVYLRTVQIAMNSISQFTSSFLGTQYNTYTPVFGLGNNLFSEGYLGRTWDWFANYIASPFVFSETVPIDVDFQKYFNETLTGEVPDMVVFFLGICDVTSLTGIINVDTIDNWINAKIFHETRMGKVIKSIESDAPNAKIGIVLIPPVNERYYTYIETLYGVGEEGWWNRRQKHHRLVQRYIDYFNSYGNPNISVIPVYLNIDTYSDFGETDAIHPTFNGYYKIGDSIYGWIKYQISQMMTEPNNLSISYNGISATLNWNASSGAYLYHIYRSPDPYGEYIEIGTTSLTNYTDFISGTVKYFYKITADNSLK